MNNGEQVRPVPWKEAAIAACQSPLPPVNCPSCGATALVGEWNLLSATSRETSVDLHCSGCGVRASVRISLPERAAACWPLQRLPLVIQAIEEEAESLAGKVRQHAKAMPAAAFTTHPLWQDARWSATTYTWHPTSEAPPIMGLVFENFEAGLAIFRDSERQMRHEDRFDEIRVSIIEGAVTGQEQRPGYSVHICADSDALAARATLDDLVVDPSVVPFLGQWNRHYPVPGAPPLRARFKHEFGKHNEFLLAPAIRLADGKLYIEPTLGIVKKIIFFRQLSDITTPDDTDAAALMLPQLILPPE